MLLMTQDGCSHVKLLPYKTVLGNTTRAVLGTPLPAPGTPGLSTIQLYAQPWQTLHQRLVQDLLGNGLECSFYHSIQPGAVPFPRIQAHPSRLAPPPLWSQSQAPGSEPTVHPALWKYNSSC